MKELHHRLFNLPRSIYWVHCMSFALLLSGSLTDAADLQLAPNPAIGTPVIVASSHGPRPELKLPDEVRALRDFDIAGGYHYALGIDAFHRVVAFPLNTGTHRIPEGVLDVPEGLEAVRVVADGKYPAALTKKGRVVTWGASAEERYWDTSSEQVVQVFKGGHLLHADGSVTMGRGHAPRRMRTVDLTEEILSQAAMLRNVIQIYEAAGIFLALHGDGSVTVISMVPEMDDLAEQIRAKVTQPVRALPLLVGSGHFPIYILWMQDKSLLSFAGRETFKDVNDAPKVSSLAFLTAGQTSSVIDRRREVIIWGNAAGQFGLRAENRGFVEEEGAFVPAKNLNALKVTGSAQFLGVLSKSPDRVQWPKEMQPWVFAFE